MSAKSLRIMIVDDSAVIRRSIERYLTSNGIDAEFHTASDGQEAVDLFEQVWPQVVTLDITMPEMDGLCCLQELLKRDENAKVLIVSALADTDTAVEALTLGAAEYLCKPFTEQELADCIVKLIDQVEMVPAHE